MSEATKKPKKKPGPPKGIPKVPGSGGSRKGKPNKVTAKAREVIAEVIDGTAPRVQAWIDEVASTDPKSALQCYIALLEFGVPKLARTEITGKDGGDLFAPDQVLTMAEAIKRAKKMDESSMDGSKAD